MAFADAGARRLLRGAGGGVARGIAADAVGMSFGLDGLWQLIAGLFASVAHLLVLPFEVLGHWLQAAVAAVAHLVVLPFEALWHLLQSAAAGVSFCFDSLVAALGSAAHALVVPFEALWHLLQSAVAGVSFCFDNLVAALGSAAHALAVPFETLWQWIQAAPASISFGFHGLGQLIHGCFDVFWEHMQGIFAGVPAALASAAHSLVLPLESFWRWVHNSIAGISLDLDGFWPLVQRFVDTAASKAHELVPALEAFWRWLKDAAVVALPYVLAIAAVVCVAAVAWYCWQILCTAAVQVAKALVQVLSSCWGWLYGVAMLVGPCCGHVTMAAPGVAGGLMSRVAFETAPRLFFQISRSAGGPVATAVFSTPTIASAVAAPVAALFGG
ncbi:unnamed protein product [Triticum turgidum subsp. durum]|uniref:Uncharacterized protein n=1 Tax=Triticum turgidum subsp. durum TaxID=4567 RepID=A0A9R0U1J6_TRITD|nr:unnamed protein product [Triticum turgidum subsp. durum]